MTTSVGGNSSGGGSNVDSALQKYQAAQDTATEKNLQVTTETTKIKGDGDAIKKLSP